jgi:aminoglycoside/choline kinase family phosphotransferase
LQIVETHVDSTPDLRGRIDGYLREVGLTPTVASVVLLTADASDRRYFRVVRQDGGSIVLALHAGPIDFAALPFANVCELLQQVPLPVPAILGHSDSFGVIALQDLGDITLQSHLAVVSGSEQIALYREAVDLIVRLQRRGAELTSKRYLPYTMAFDIEKLTWELDFFHTHFVEGYRGITLAPAARGALSEEWRVLAGELAGEPRVLCHRDYHSRNLMVHEGRLHIIDFQDARMGPDTYDLASLLRDSYVDLTEAQLDELLRCYVDGSARCDRVEMSEFRRRFDLMAVQRNLKALGTFGFMATARRNPAYVQYMPRTIGYVRRNLEKYSRFARLREVLGTHIEELR